jgi:hypothetical protein
LSKGGEWDVSVEWERVSDEIELEKEEDEEDVMDLLVGDCGVESIFDVDDDCKLGWLLLLCKTEVNVGVEYALVVE